MSTSKKDKIKDVHTHVKTHTLTKHKVVHKKKHRYTKKTLLERSGLMSNLEMYAFWTGVASTLISLIQVFVLANK